MKKQFRVLPFLTLFVLAGCELFNPGKSYYKPSKETLRTYPEALDLETTTVQQAKVEVLPPDSINVDAYAVSISACPPNTYCILPDGIIISDSLHSQSPGPQLFLQVRNPKQFEKDQLYRFSLQIGTYPGNGEKRFELLGYSQLLRYD
ncbi:MAG TPA: hypothetical protein VJ964_16335 [Balneolaceae bacterium]|nr:hypothetical protein [Balneolaceae bacterium]